MAPIREITGNPPTRKGLPALVYQTQRRGEELGDLLAM